MEKIAILARLKNTFVLYCDDAFVGYYASTGAFEEKLSELFKLEINLVGKDEDGTIVKNDGIKSYFGEKNHEAENIAVSSWQMEIAYQYAEKYSRENGFRVYNATRGGYLEVFERVDFDSLFIKDGNNES